MKSLLDWSTKEVVSVFDEVTLWSAPFGKLLLENIPMKRGAVVVDIGFGTGFPLIELSQRFGESSIIYGIDIWQEGIWRTQRKMEVLGLTNIELLTESASSMAIENEKVDLVTSNLSINNFEDKEKVYAEISRILKPGGNLCLCTNPMGTFAELFDLFESVLKEMNLQEEQRKFFDYLQHRSTAEKIINEIEVFGFRLVNRKEEETHMRFADASALLDHSLIRIGFREYWEHMIQNEKATTFFERLVEVIDELIHSHGSFKMTIPILYLEFKKN